MKERLSVCASEIRVHIRTTSFSCCRWRVFMCANTRAYRIIVIAWIFIYDHKWCDNSVESTMCYCCYALRTTDITKNRYILYEKTAKKQQQQQQPLAWDTHNVTISYHCQWCGCKESGDKMKQKMNWINEWNTLTFSMHFEWCCWRQ